MSDVCIVTVKRPAMILQTPTVEMYENESKSLIALSNGVESATEEIEWISSNEKVAKVRFLDLLIQ
jgi:ketopantoate reductase